MKSFLMKCLITIDVDTDKAMLGNDNATVFV